MYAALDLKTADKLLEIGTGSGYQLSKWAESGCEVHSIELEPWISEVHNDGCTTIYLHSGDGQLGLPQEAPFTAIVATCGVEQIPGAWCSQLASGGRLVAPVGDSRAQRLTLFGKDGSELVPQRILAYTRFQMLRQRPAPGKLRYTGDNA